MLAEQFNLFLICKGKPPYYLIPQKNTLLFSYSHEICRNSFLLQGIASHAAPGSNVGGRSRVVGRNKLM
jgi:hypothetical protein